MLDKHARMQSVASISNRFNGLQVMVNKAVPTVEGLFASATLSDNTFLLELINAEAGPDVNRSDLINRPGNAAWLHDDPSYDIPYIYVHISLSGFSTMIKS